MSANPKQTLETPLDSKNIIEEKNPKTGEIKKYTKGRFLGKGGFAKVYEFTEIENKVIFAAKVIPKNTLLITEIKIHRSLNNENVVNFEHVFEDNENVYILLELCNNQTLNELLKRRKRLTEIEVQCYILQILTSLKYIHSKRVIHRDLKLGNLFVSSSMMLKLGDFGLATKLNFDGEKKRTVCGTPNYIAPEILDGKCGHSYEVDVWSLGVILYTLIIGKPPFETNDVKSTYKKIKLNSYSFPENVQISENAKNLIESILQANPLQRPTVNEIFEHPFLNNCFSIPKLLPISTLACPPSSSYLRKYLNTKTLTENDLENNPNPIVKSATIKENYLKTNLNTIDLNNKLIEKKDFVNTDRSGKQTNFNNNFLNEINTNYLAKEKKNDLFIDKNKEIFLEKDKKNDFFLEKDKKNDFFLTKTEGLKSQRPKECGDNINNCIAKIWVVRWVDYSSKYGLGYLLSNGYSGVCFNDATKIIFSEKKNNNKQDIPNIYSLDNYPKDLQKKVTLLQHFKNYLENDKEGHKPLNLTSDTTSTSSIYIKKWIKTKHAMMFRLSNRVVQVVFQDNTEILLSSELKLVTYVSKKNERIDYPLSIALESTNKEMTKRLKYTKDILTQMIGGNVNNLENLEEEKKKTEGNFEGKNCFGKTETFGEKLKFNF